MPAREQPPAGESGERRLQRPTGTRDFYAADMLRKRYVEGVWRDAALRHAFDEIDGPTFEHLDLYTRKSGEGIVSELFSFRRAGGEQDYALRPELTPTVARMHAERAASLPKPTKWFSIGPFFRAERPQRGRLREFTQWNVDILGDDSPEADAELIACCVEALRDFGLEADHLRIQLGDRGVAEQCLLSTGATEEDCDRILSLLDRRDRLEEAEVRSRCDALGFDLRMYDPLVDAIHERCADGIVDRVETDDATVDLSRVARTVRLLEAAGGLDAWATLNMNIVRGLAYYTGMVFEVHEAGGKERAIAGGGRYDNLIELMGGPPTPAVGFAMGDVVLSLVLEDRGLMPEGVRLLEATGARPDAFVISTGSEPSEAALPRVLATLRENALHARRTHRSTRNVGKLLKEASQIGARTAVIIDDASEQARVKNLDTGEETPDMPLDQIAGRVRAMCTPSLAERTT